MHGAVEHIGPNGVSGWCVDEDADVPVCVELRVDSVLLMTVRADIYRQDIEKSLQQPLAGFRFPISTRLRRLLPHGGTIEVSANGTPLRLLPRCDPVIDNPGVPSIAQLLERLNSGFIITPKYGAIFRPLHMRERFRRSARASVEACRRIFKDVVGKDLFLCYGTLLGYVREGKIIEHDDDIDLCFLADSDGWAGAFAEFMDAVERLRQAGQHVDVDCAVQFHWRLKGWELDVFMGWTQGDRLNMYEVSGHLPRHRLLPLKPARFMGLDVFVPNDPEALLRLIYGEDWRIPDPNFQWRSTPEVARLQRLYETADAAVRATNARAAVRKRYWAEFYERRPRMAAPSAFAASIATELADRSRIVDIGCGDGRDSFFFASLGHHVLGLDAAGTVIAGNNAFAKDDGRESVAFREADVSEPGVLATALRSHMEGASSRSNFVVYGRFLIHAVTDDEERAILEALAELPSGARCYFEFRTTKDAALVKRFGGHYRRYVDVDALIKRAGKFGNLDCHYRVEGRGLAKYGEEDPIVARLHLQRR